MLCVGERQCLPFWEHSWEQAVSEQGLATPKSWVVPCISNCCRWLRTCSQTWRRLCDSVPVMSVCEPLSWRHEGTQVEPAVPAENYEDYGSDGPNAYVDLSYSYVARWRAGHPSRDAASLCERPHKGSHFRFLWLLLAF